MMTISILSTMDTIIEQSGEFLKDREDLNGVDVLSEWKLLMNAKQIEASVRYCAHHINKNFKGQDIVVVCILKGCAYFFVDLTRHLKIPYSTYFIEASSYHNKQTQSDQLEILSVIVPEKFKNKQVILLDELYDNGLTFTNVKKHLIENNIVPEDKIFSMTLFKKDKQTSYPPPDLHGITVPDVWLVGYGLDDQQEKRGWSHLYACPKLDGLPKTDADKMFEDDKYFLNEVNKLNKQIKNAETVTYLAMKGIPIKASQ